MKPWIAAGLFCLLAFPVRGGSDTPGRTAELFDRLVAKNKGFGGGVLRVSDAKGLLWERAAGISGGPGSAPMTPETPFEIASITKTLAAATILRLVEEGKLRLDSRLSGIFPTDQLRGFDGNITVQQLLSHTSGLPDYWTDRPRDFRGSNAFLRAFLAEPDRIWKPEEILAFARGMPAKPAPAKFHYSDTNYVLLGLLVEHLTKQPLHRVFSERIFRPLGMRDTWLTYRENRRSTPASHRFEGREDLHAVPRQSADWASGGLVSTTRDLEKFLRGMVSGKLFHDPATLETMRKAVPTGDDGISYGLGIFRVDLGNGLGEVWGHDGHGNSFAYYWPERGIFFTGTLNQTNNDWWPLVEAEAGRRDAGFAIRNTGKTFQCTLGTGWDSLYMFRGVNALREGQHYGSGIAWTDLNVDWNPTDRDSLSLEVWHCFGTRHTTYKEIDITLTYTRTVGDLSFSF